MGIFVRRLALLRSERIRRPIELTEEQKLVRGKLDYFHAGDALPPGKNIHSFLVRARAQCQ